MRFEKQLHHLCRRLFLDSQMKREVAVVGAVLNLRTIRMRFEQQLDHLCWRLFLDRPVQRQLDLTVLYLRNLGTRFEQLLRELGRRGFSNLEKHGERATHYI